MTQNELIEEGLRDPDTNPLAFHLALIVEALEGNALLLEQAESHAGYLQATIEELEQDIREARETISALESLGK
jgi:hypothetical protein